MADKPSVTIDALTPTRALPAISADGSRPDAAFLGQPEPKKAEDAAPETKVEEPKAEPEKKADETSAKPEKAKDETPAPIKREFTRLRNEKRDADERAAKLETRLDQALAALEKVSGKAATAQQTGEDDPRPSRTKFTDPDQYEQAVDGWYRRQTARTVQAEIEAREAKKVQEDRTRRETEYVTELQKEVTSARDEFIAEHPDYEDVAENPDLQISTNLGAALVSTRKDFPKLAYWLGQNPDEAARLSKLNVQAAAYELGRIADRLTAKPAASAAPRTQPIKPISGGRQPAGRDRNDPNNVDMEARLKELRTGAKPFFPSQQAGRPN